VTAKEKLLEYVSALTEEEAEDKLPWIAPMFERPSGDRRLSAAERAAIERGLRDADAGLLIPIEEVEAEFGDD
jgi:hypothetical protein